MGGETKEQRQCYDRSLKARQLSVAHLLEKSYTTFQYRYCNLMDVIQVKSPAEMGISEILDMLERFNRFGFAILQHEPSINPKKHLLSLSKYFGSIIYHDHSDLDGIVSVAPVDGSSAYVNTTTTELPLHTDASFEEIPPKIVALQCEIAAESGGLTTLGDGQLVYNYIAQARPMELSTLFHPGAITVQRTNRQTTKPIFEEYQGRIHMRFRSDSAANILVKPEVIDVFNSIKEFLGSPRNQILLKLHPDQIIIMNNSRILHGRTAFSNGHTRKLNRIWFDGMSSYAHYLKFGFYPNIVGTPPHLLPLRA